LCEIGEASAQVDSSTSPHKRKDFIVKRIPFLVLGIVFGFLLSRSGAADYGYIQKMFLFEDIQLYGIIGTAVCVTAPLLWIVKRLKVSPKPKHLGNVVGGVLFGIGWALTGMCPGPVLVGIGEGKLYALCTFAGVLVGTALLGVVYPRLQVLGVPPLEQGPGDG
jgi:uncharacterized protein